LDKLRALHEEVAAAQDEGARFMAQVDAVRITHRTNGSIAGLVIRSRVDGIERILPADLLIIACGFRAKPAAWLLECGVTFNMDGQIMIDNHRTANPKIFAGGDAVRGADLAVRAFVDGRDAAEEILRTFTPNTN
jgi:glutamate synthase (NADPH/NADH) small chain